jgi:type IV pilus assembly protein PilW
MTAQKERGSRRDGGFTLVEVLVAMTISSIVAGAVFMAYKSQQESYLNQEQVALMQQNLRAAIFYMEREIRMAGYDTASSTGAGIVTAAPNSIRFTMDVTGGENDGVDNDQDGVVDEDTDGIDNDGNGQVDDAIESDEFRFGDGVLDDPNEDITYALLDLDGDGDMDISRADPTVVPADPAFPVEQFVAENIEALGFAYAFDNDNDGFLDTYNVAGNPEVIWAVDTDGDGDLDANLDTDGDGDIDADDGPGMGGNGTIWGNMLMDFNWMAIADVPPANIRAVRVWILARSGRRDTTFLDRNTYVVGNQVITPSTDGDPNNDHRRMRLLMTTIECRNL